MNDVWIPWEEDPPTRDGSVIAVFRNGMVFCMTGEEAWRRQDSKISGKAHFSHWASLSPLPVPAATN